MSTYLKYNSDSVEISPDLKITYNNSIYYVVNILDRANKKLLDSIQLTQSEYDNLSLINNSTIYCIVEKDYVDLGLPTGTLWSRKNFNINSLTDSITDYGGYYAWGEIETKASYTWSNYKYANEAYDKLTKYNTSSSYGTVDNKTELDDEDDVVRVNLGSDWCMPNQKQITELVNYTYIINTTINNVKGCLIVSKINGNSIFLPYSGYMINSNKYATQASAMIWSKTNYTLSGYLYYYTSGNKSASITPIQRIQGSTIRPIYVGEATEDSPKYFYFQGVKFESLDSLKEELEKFLEVTAASLNDLEVRKQNLIEDLDLIRYGALYSFGTGYGTCATEEATLAKVGTYSNYALTTGGIVGIKFTYGVPAGSTLNINSKGVKAIYSNGVAIKDGVIKAGDIALFMYNGSLYCLLAVDSDPNTLATAASNASSALTKLDNTVEMVATLEDGSTVTYNVVVK